MPDIFIPTPRIRFFALYAKYSFVPDLFQRLQKSRKVHLARAQRSLNAQATWLLGSDTIFAMDGNDTSAQCM